jgi:acyl transferase domain-containing protein
VVLQLRHKELVPSIKAEKLNPNLSFEGTPFRLQQALQDWPQPVIEIDGERREVPRRAMINSFGAGGSYANLIVEEYVAESVPPQTSGSTDDGPVAVVLSAKTQDRLKALVQRMLERVQGDAGICLSDLAYTLQTAREAMDVRVAWVVQNRDELVQAMTQYLALQEEGGEEAGNGGFSSDAKEQSKIRMLLSGRTGETLVQSLLAERDLEKLALLWTQGAKIGWQALYEGQQARRISLPTYPFAKIRFPAARELAHAN